MRYTVTVTVIGEDNANMLHRIFPALEMKNSTPMFRQKTSNASTWRFTFDGVLSSGHADMIDLVNVCASFGDSFEHLAYTPAR